MINLPPFEPELVLSQGYSLLGQGLAVGPARCDVYSRDSENLDGWEYLVVAEDAKGKARVCSTENVLKKVPAVSKLVEILRHAGLLSEDPSKANEFIFKIDHALGCEMGGYCAPALRDRAIDEHIIHPERWSLLNQVFVAFPEMEAYVYLESEGKTLHTQRHTLEEWAALHLESNAEVHAQKRLTAAIFSGHLDAAIQALDEGACASGVPGAENIPLQLAVSRGHDKIVGCLIETGAQMNCLDGQGNTPLHASIELQPGQLEAIVRLIDAGADINHRNREGVTPLHAAVKGKHPELAQTLLKAGAQVNTADDQRNTPLLDADKLDMFRLLIAAGANVNTAGPLGRTPLHKVSTRKGPEYAQVLLEAGADINASDDDGNTVLHFSNDSNCLFLIEAGADINAKKISKRTPLHTATWLMNNESVRNLVRAGAKVNLRDESGNTPLCIAALRGAAVAAHWLIEGGADLTLRNRAGKTALMCAEINDRQEIAMIIRAALARQEALVAVQEMGGACSRRL